MWQTPRRCRESAPRRGWRRREGCAAKRLDRHRVPANHPRIPPCRKSGPPPTDHNEATWLPRTGVGVKRRSIYSAEALRRARRYDNSSRPAMRIGQASRMGRLKKSLE